MKPTLSEPYLPKINSKAVEGTTGKPQSYLDSVKWNAAAAARLTLMVVLPTLESVIDVGQGINVGPGKFVKKNKRRALNKCRA